MSTGTHAFSAGLISFFSPCILPLVPSFLIYISGATIRDCSDFQDKSFRRSVLLHSVFFIAGFSLVFITLGLSSSILGSLFAAYQKWIMVVGGIVLIVMGLNMLGLFKIPFLNREKTVHVEGKAGGFLGSVLVGVTFSLGWTPCIGPVLASILIISATGKSVWGGFYLLGLYSLGLAIPFFLSGCFCRTADELHAAVRPHSTLCVDGPRRLTHRPRPFARHRVFSTITRFFG